MERNLLDHTPVEGIQNLKNYLQKCGHKHTTLDKIEPKAATLVLVNMPRPLRDADHYSKELSLVFSLKFLPDSAQFYILQKNMLVYIICLYVIYLEYMYLCVSFIEFIFINGYIVVYII